jgi:hypothetical protein
MRLATVIVVASLLTRFGSAAEDLVKRGIREYALGKFKKAVATLAAAVQESRDQKGIATARKYLAAVHAALGDPQSARVVLEAALKVDPTVTIEAERFPPALVSLFLAVRNAMKGEIRVECNRDNALIEVVGQASGRCGATFEVAIGTHTVRASASGEKAPEKSVVVFHKSRERVEFRFAPIPAPVSAPAFAPAAASAPAPAPAPASTTVAAPLRESAAPPLPPAPSRARRIASWSLIGVGVLSVVAGAVLQLNVLSERAGQDRANANGSGAYTTTDRAVLTSRDIVAKGLFIAGGVVATAGITLLLMRASSAVGRRVSRIPLDIGIARAPDGQIAPVVWARWTY